MLPERAVHPRFVGDRRIETIEKPVPRPGPGQLLLRCRANALCASECGAFLHGCEVTPGHEAAGEVVAAGPETSTSVGTPGVVFLMDFCGECRSCRLGLTNQCLHKRADYGFSHDGGYGPYELVNENVFFPAEGDMDFAERTLLLDVMGTGGHAIRRACTVHPDPGSLLVTGAGPIGLGVLAMAKLVLGSDFPVAIADTIPFRLDLAAKLGGLPVNVAEASLGDGLKSHGLADVDLAIDCTGVGAAVRDAIDLLAKRGVLACVGHGAEVSLRISPDLIGPERTVLGSEYFRYDEMPANLELLKENLGYVGQIITHRFPVAQIEEAFETFLGRNTGKVVVVQ